MTQKNKENKKKKTQEQIWTENLASDDKQKVKDTIKEIRDFGNLAILPTLVDKFAQEQDAEIRKEIEKLLTDIKDKRAAEMLFAYVNDDKYKHIKRDLIGILWQSRLDFSPYLEQLIDIFITDPFDVAFEAFTTIEYFDKAIEPALAEACIAKLKNNMDKMEQQRKFLMVDLVNMLQKRSEKKS